MKILFCVNREFAFSGLPQWFADRAAREFDAEVVRLASYAGLDAEIAATDVLVSWSLREPQWEKAKRLCWIHCPASGANGVLCAGVVESAIPVTNAAEVHGNAVAEHVMALMLAAARRLDCARDLQSASRWSMDDLWDARPRPRQLRGAHVLVVGMGQIGRRVAEYCSALGMLCPACGRMPQSLSMEWRACAALRRSTSCWSRLTLWCWPCRRLRRRGA